MQIFLLSMQAAGMAADYIGTRNEIRQGKRAQELDESRIKIRIEEEGLASLTRSVAAMQDLRQILANQRAIFAARGQSSGTGTAFTIGNKSVSSFNSDERIRKMNLLSKQAQLRAHNTLGQMHQQASETRLGQGLLKRSLDTVSTGELGNLGKDAFGIT